MTNINNNDSNKLKICMFIYLNKYTICIPIYSFNKIILDLEDLCAY